MSGPSRPAGEHTDVYIAQQRAILDVLEHCSVEPEANIEQLLRGTLEARNIPVPPEPWLHAVAGEIANDHLYVVANGMVPNEYFSGASGGRAADRAQLAGHDLQPPESSTERMAEGHAPGNQIA